MGSLRNEPRWVKPLFQFQSTFNTKSNAYDSYENYKDLKFKICLVSKSNISSFSYTSPYQVLKILLLNTRR